MSGYHETIRLFNTYSIKELVAILQSLNEGIRFLDHCISSDVLPISKLVRQYSAQTRKMVVANDTEQTRGLAKVCTKNIEETITNLQIHDSISQKLDHIHVFQTGIINDLVSLKEASEVSETPYLSVCGEIIEMNRDQLLLIRTEYEQAVVTIQRNLLDIESKMGTQDDVPGSKGQFFVHYPEFEKAADGVTEKMLQVSGRISPSYRRVSDSLQKLQAITTLFTMESERKVLHKILKGENSDFLEDDLQGDPDLDQTEFF